MEEIENGRVNQKIEAEGDAEKVFSDISNFTKERESGNEPVDGPLLMILSGAQRGVYGAGGCVALEQLGLRNGFKTAVGVSAGSATISYFFSGQVEMGTTIFYEENTTQDFIDLRRGGQGKSAVDISWLIQNVFKSGIKKLNTEKLIKNKTEIYYAVTDAITGYGELLNMKYLTDPIDGIKASIAIPEMYIEKVQIEVGGIAREFVDGAVAYPFPVREILQKTRPTSILVFANRPKNTQRSFFQSLIKKYQSLIVKDVLSKNILLEDEIFKEELYELKNCGIPYTIIWTDSKIDLYEKNPIKLKQAAEDFKNFVLNLN